MLIFLGDQLRILHFFLRKSREYNAYLSVNGCAYKNSNFGLLLDYGSIAHPRKGGTHGQESC